MVGLERLSLPTGAIQRQHELASQPLPERMPCQLGLELADEVVMVSERQVGVHAILQGASMQLLEARDLRLGKRLVPELGERRTAPQSQCAVKRPARGARIAVRQSPPTGVQQCLKPLDIELLGLDAQHVPGEQRVTTTLRAPVVRPGSRPAQPRNGHLESPDRLLAVLAAPQLIDQVVARHHLVGIQQQQGEQRSLLWAPKRESPVAVGHLDRPQDAKVH